MNNDHLFREKKTKRKNFLLALGIFGVVVVAIIGVIFYMAYDDLKQEDLLKKEVVTLSNKNLDKDDFTVNIVTKGDYVYVEEAIKKFYLELSNNVKQLSSVFSDQEFLQILGADNIVSDGSNFTKSLATIDDAIKNIKESTNNIVDLCDEDTVLNLIDKNKIDDYYVDFYKELMLSDSDKAEFEDVKKEMMDLSMELEEFLNKAKEILLMLKSNSNSWSVVDGQIYFTTDNLVNDYNRLYNELKDKANKIQKYNKSSNNGNNNKENVA